MRTPITDIATEPPRRFARRGRVLRRTELTGGTPFPHQAKRRMEPTTLRMDAAPTSMGPRQTVHLIGVCGSGMRALAELLLGLKWTVSGSDLQRPTPAVQQFIRHGLAFRADHAAEHVPVNANCVVYSPAVPVTNPERQAAERRGIPQYSYTEMLARLLERRSGVCVAGTHGKSTTTAMTGCI